MTDAPLSLPVEHLTSENYMSGDATLAYTIAYGPGCSCTRCLSVGTTTFVKDIASGVPAPSKVAIEC